MVVDWAVYRVVGSRHDTLRTPGGALHRAVLLALVDLPIDYMPMLIQHEAFGHGTRMRETGYDAYAVRLSPLWPYGSGHGYTVGARAPQDLSLDESLAIHGAGMDANDVFARSLRLRWAADGRLDRHQALLYALNAGNRRAYLVRTWSGFAASPGAGDVNLLISGLNHRNGNRTLSDRPFDIDDLAYRTLPALLDPFAWTAAPENGAGLWLTIRWREARGLLLELGGKTRGYVQGEPLGAVLMARGGLSFAWPG